MNFGTGEYILRNGMHANIKREGEKFSGSIENMDKVFSWSMFTGNSLTKKIDYDIVQFIQSERNYDRSNDSLSVHRKSKPSNSE